MTKGAYAAEQQIYNKISDATPISPSSNIAIFC